MGSFKFKCVFCRQKIEAEDEWSGMFAQCPNCGRQIKIRRDDEFAVKPSHTRLAPEKPQEKEVPIPSNPTFRKPFPPKMPRTPMPEMQAPPSAEEEAPIPAPKVPEAPKPFPHPFSVEQPNGDKPKK